MRRIEYLLFGSAVVVPPAEVTHDVLHHHHGSIHHHSEIQCAQGQQVRRNSLQLQTSRGEQERKWDGQRDDDRSADVAEKHQQNNHDENDSLGEVV